MNTKKTNKKSTIKNSKKVQSKYKTTNGIQELPNGNFRIRKTINGIKYDAHFTSRPSAVQYLNLLKKEIIQNNINNLLTH